jgi:hypothetical protein
MLPCLVGASSTAHRRSCRFGRLVRDCTLAIPAMQEEAAALIAGLVFESE